MEILSTHYPTAKKDHKCSYCGFKILTGEQYIYTPIKGDGFYVWKSHFNCQILAETLHMFNDCNEGVTGNDFAEYINNEYQDRWKDKENGLKTFKERFDFVCKIHSITV